jgi:hypothetical protein
MPMKLCPAGKHFFNPDVHAECPSCQEDAKLTSGTMEMSLKIPKTDKVEEDAAPGRRQAPVQAPKTKPLLRNRQPSQDSGPERAATPENPFQTRPAQRELQAPPRTRILIGGKQAETPSGDEPAMDVLPVVGWLVVLEGPGRGRDFRLIQGENKIGRDASMEICLDFGEHSDATVSREAHAILVYDGNANEFFIERGSSRNLPMLNDKSIRRDQNLTAGDVIQVGQTKLLFVALCNEEFQW